ncbi:hypothetical protein BD413DRAFT_50938 [Trametes elegans]|nr:hypothetical protein BD413DRAFT_50938 [Trametes elegans]
MERIRAWERADAETQYLLVRNLPDDMLPLVDLCRIVEEMWEEIRRQHCETSAKVRTFAAMDRMSSRACRNGASLVVHARQSVRGNDALREFSQAQEDTVLATVIICSIPWKRLALGGGDLLSDLLRPLSPTSGGNLDSEVLIRMRESLNSLHCLNGGSGQPEGFGGPRMGRRGRRPRGPSVADQRRKLCEYFAHTSMT